MLILGDVDMKTNKQREQTLNRCPSVNVWAMVQSGDQVGLMMAVGSGISGQWSKLKLGQGRQHWHQQPRTVSQDHRGEHQSHLLFKNT